MREAISIFIATVLSSAAYWGSAYCARNFPECSGIAGFAAFFLGAVALAVIVYRRL